MTPKEANAAARTWAEADHDAAVRHICTADSLRRLRRHYVSLRRADTRLLHPLHEVLKVVRLGVRALQAGASLAKADAALYIDGVNFAADAPMLIVRHGDRPAVVFNAGLPALLAKTAVNAAGLSALATAWQARPRTVDPFPVKNRGSLPRLERMTATEARQLPMFTREAELMANRGAPAQPVLKTLNGSLPAFDESLGVNPSWLLSLFDAAAGKSMTRGGTGAPWVMHLFIGALLHTPIRARTGGIVSLPFTTSQIIRWFHEGRWKNQARDWPILATALDSLGSLRVYVPDVGRVGLVYARVIPHSWDDGRGVVFETRIPYSAASGARIDWPKLCEYRRESAPLYRAYLSVCALMDKSARNGLPLTREIHPTLLLPSGKPQRGKGGRIVRDKSTLVPNPASRFVDAVSDTDLARMFGFHADHRESKKRARRLLERLEEDEIVEVERLARGRFRLFGPAPAKLLIP